MDSGASDVTEARDGAIESAAEAAIEASADSGADASADATADTGTLPDSPTDGPFTGVTGLVLWLDAAKGITQTAGAVSGWADQTTFHNDASQPVASLQPTLIPSGIHGLPVVHFNEDAGGSSPSTGAGDQLVIADAPSLQWGTGPFYIAIVGDFDNPLDAGGPEREVGLLYGKWALDASSALALTGNIPLSIDASSPIGLGLSTNTANGDWVYTNTAYDDGTPHLFSAQRVSGNLVLRVDGVNVATSPVGSDDIGIVGAPVTIGSGSSGRSIRLDGDIAEMLAVEGTLAKTDRDDLEQYLLSKYGL
jgi:hypothetical protein